MARISVRALAAELNTTPKEIADYLEHCGIRDINGLSYYTHWLLHEDEEELVRDHWDTDPTPQHQYQVTEGGRTWDQDKRDEHDGSL